MKVMNEVPAPRDGIVTEILVSNEEMVEFGKDWYGLMIDIQAIKEALPHRYPMLLVESRPRNK